MDGDLIARLAYMVLLGTAVVGWFIAQNRTSLGKVAQQAIIWVLIFVGMIAGYGLWQDMRGDILGRQTVLDGNAIEVPRAIDGHFYLSLTLNAVPVNFVVDTGATDMVLSLPDATAIGISTRDLAFTGRASTANGIVKTAPVILDEVRLGPIVDRNVRAVVNQGELEGSLLGMGYLERFARIEIVGNKLVLTR
ncbi:TIGR02281 family clan AA aspartic protease [Aestuariibius sp. HNIBRBA575]|uniref:retropepsin-like aspartic protease family protein n=1 Tax=Aestuariibius sp. HNIBRBA575 TaxID=3233343 RepID=UPI0034A2E224